MPVSLVTVPDDFALKHVQRSEQRRGPVAFIVMGHRAAASLHQRQARLGTV